MVLWLQLRTQLLVPAGLDRLELLRRNAMSGPSQAGTPPVATPSLQRDSQLPAVSEAEPAAGVDEEYQYQPTKVRHLRFAGCYWLGPLIHSVQAVDDV